MEILIYNYSATVTWTYTLGTASAALAPGEFTPSSLGLKTNNSGIIAFSDGTTTYNVNQANIYAYGVSVFQIYDSYTPPSTNSGAMSYISAVFSTSTIYAAFPFASYALQNFAEWCTVVNPTGDSALPPVTPAYGWIVLMIILLIVVVISGVVLIYYIYKKMKKSKSA